MNRAAVEANPGTWALRSARPAELAVVTGRLIRTGEAGRQFDAFKLATMRALVMTPRAYRPAPRREGIGRGRRQISAPPSCGADRRD